MLVLYGKGAYEWVACWLRICLVLDYCYFSVQGLVDLMDEYGDWWGGGGNLAVVIDIGSDWVMTGVALLGWWRHW